MPSLRELQVGLAGALFDGAPGSVASVIRAGSLGVGRRIEIYRANVLSNYTEALRQTYPVTERLVGEAYFRHVARRYAIEVPSRHGDLNRSGGSFAGFLTGCPGLAGLPYLPDVARLEWGIEESFHAADDIPLDLAGLADAMGEDLADIGLSLSPPCRLLASPYPVHRIWAANQPGRSGDGVDLREGGCRLLLYRPQVEVQIEALSTGEYGLLSLLTEGVALRAALEQVLAVESDFDAAQCLMRMATSGVLGGIRRLDAGGEEVIEVLGNRDEPVRCGTDTELTSQGNRPAGST